MSLDAKYYIMTNKNGEKHSIVRWYNDFGWFQTDARTPWKKSFAFFPKKSCFSYKHIWGKCCKRTVKYMCDYGSNGLDSAIRDTEYATQKETFEDKLKGAI